MKNPRRPTVISGRGVRRVLLLLAGLLLILVATPHGTAVADHRNETHLSGVLPRLAIGCRFANLANVTPVGDEQMRVLMGDGRSGVTAWWQEVSYGAIEPAGEWLGWVEMDGVRDDYLRDLVFTYTEELGDTWNAALLDCASKAAELTDLSQYDALDLFFNTRLGGFWGSRFEFTIAGITKE